ncbi:MAG TPA: dienelactone hydrolase family protein [Casimicrobiaceae bacterium]|nr:dienelactone hydrolase family protein [Casimicrobiaceae bacterium]
MTERSSSTLAPLEIRAGAARLPGELALPRPCQGIVLFAHGSGSSRSSPRNVYVARELQRAGIGTLLFDLLTPAEDRAYETRFDIRLLTARLRAATDHVVREPAAAGLPIGYFGASTGAAAALAAAAAPDARIAAVVSRGGRPDLAGADLLGRVRAPTLLLVGGFDDEVIALNRRALEAMTCAKALHIVPGATHLFEEPGTLEQVAAAASAWFSRWLG